MKVLKDEPVKRSKKTEPSPRDLKMISEIEEFMAADCQYAELWSDDSVSMTTNLAAYQSILRRRKIWQVEIHQRNKRVVAFKDMTKERPKWL